MNKTIYVCVALIVIFLVGGSISTKEAYDNGYHDGSYTKIGYYDSGDQLFKPIVNWGKTCSLSNPESRELKIFTEIKSFSNGNPDLVLNCPNK